MAAVAFDTLKLAMKLEKSGFTPKQSQETAVALAESFGEWQATINLATKDDLREAESRLEAKISDTKSEIIKWMFGTIGVQTIVIIGAVLGILRFSGH